MPSAAKTASNALVNRESRSRSRNFTVVTRHRGLSAGCERLVWSTPRSDARSPRSDVSGGNRARPRSARRSARGTRCPRTCYVQLHLARESVLDWPRKQRVGGPKSDRSNDHGHGPAVDRPRGTGDVTCLLGAQEHDDDELTTSSGVAKRPSGTRLACVESSCSRVSPSVTARWSASPPSLSHSSVPTIPGATALMSTPVLAYVSANARESDSRAAFVTE
jgi:hypothetical protein